MHRRDALRGVLVLGSAGFAGCSGGDESARPGNDDAPLDATANDLVPPASVFDEVLDLDWEPRNELESGLPKRAQANAGYDGFDFEKQLIIHVEVGAWVFEDVETARTQYDELPYHEGWGMTSGIVGVESLEAVRDSAREYRTVWRDANAMGGITFSDPGEERSVKIEREGRELAIAMHEFWRD